MITVKVWQLVLLAVGVVVAAAAMMTMGHKSSGSTASSVTPQEQAQALQIVNVAPVVQAFFAKHRSYVHLKLAPATGVSVAAATPTGYCVETTGAAPHVFKTGPKGQLMIGTCAQPTAGTPYTG